VKGEARSRCRDNLLLLRASELSEDSLSNGGGWLYCQAVHEHRGGRRHGVLGAQSSCAASSGVETFLNVSAADKAACRSSNHVEADMLVAPRTRREAFARRK